MLHACLFVFYNGKQGWKGMNIPYNAGVPNNVPEQSSRHYLPMKMENIEHSPCVRRICCIVYNVSVIVFMLYCFCLLLFMVYCWLSQLEVKQ